METAHHFIRNINSPLLSVAPIILSGCKPLSKPLGLLSSSCRCNKEQTCNILWPSSAHFTCQCFCHFPKTIPPIIWGGCTPLTLLLDPSELGKKKITAPQDVTFAYTDLSQKGALQQMNRIHMVPSRSVASSFSHKVSRKFVFRFFLHQSVFSWHTLLRTAAIYYRIHFQTVIKTAQ